MGIVQHGRRQHPGGDVSRRLVPYTTGAMMMRPDEDLLDEIFCVVVVSEPEQPDAVHHSAVPTEGLAECGLVAGPESLHPLAV
jgi:hypothetical protein